MPNSSLPPVLLLTGTNAAAWVMDNVRMSFEAFGYVCHSLTYRHHDLPPGPERDAKLVGVSIADYVEDARQALAEIGEAPVVVGHSIGGVIAQLLAAEGAVKAGVLLNSSIVNGILPTTDGERELGKLLISAGAFWEHALEQDFELLTKYGFNTLALNLQHDIHARLGTESGRVLFEFVFWMYDVRQTTFIDPNKVSCPLLFVSGTEDKAVTPSTARLMAERYENSDFLAVNGACHYIQFEDQWPETAAKALDWLRQKL
ncbi:MULTISPECIES: alpha/beta hydrolase [unclassified Pseudovibrio]|uniref:alpha/beta hydrolase n=1 Tax=unclassified Pseudovibrio TaxID=2627060 RepID=UPI0007AECF7D|nr:MULTISPECIES: alpha/beta hydrolase [unclassified Pseudovibrio]KZL12875.1 Alpha/beta hydrolase family protein [Pseudovibrio sp. Ad26]KZL25428.1 Alpha/beta hydrolase family protein [Pseudovibrio sp. WM33]